MMSYISNLEKHFVNYFEKLSKVDNEDRDLLEIAGKEI